MECCSLLEQHFDEVALVYTGARKNLRLPEKLITWLGPILPVSSIMMHAMFKELVFGVFKCLLYYVIVEINQLPFSEITLNSVKSPLVSQS